MAQFTLHDSWNELKRYTNLRPEKVRDLLLRDRLRVGEVNCAFCGTKSTRG